MNTIAAYSPLSLQSPTGSLRLEWRRSGYIAISEKSDTRYVRQPCTLSTTYGDIRITVDPTSCLFTLSLPHEYAIISQGRKPVTKNAVLLKNK